MSSHPIGDAEPRVLPRPEHSVSRKRISSAALKVLYRLHRSGYLAYVVGGGVRDLLLGRQPKDFDVVTNARPQEIRRLFKNSRIIGRRFRLVHVLFKGETVEVATFRASPDAPEGPDEWEDAAEEIAEDEAEDVAEPAGRRRLPPATEESFGTPAEDAWRRDFTVNALFYDIADFSVIDWVGGLHDLEAGLIRSIGPPGIRFGEDPVRMLRALEYAVRLGFELEAGTRAAIRDEAGLIGDTSSARLTYELLETLRSGEARGIIAAWREHGLMDRAFPELPTGDDPRIPRMLAAVDDRVGSPPRVSDATLLGAFFVPAAADLLAELTRDGRKLDNPAYLTALTELLAPAVAGMHVANHAIHLIHHGLFTLSKLRRAPERGRQVAKLVRQEYFSTAWELFSLAVGAGVLPADDAWHGWSRAVRRFQRGEDVVVEKPGRGGRRGRRRRSGRGRRK